MHRALRCTCSMRNKFPPFSFPSSFFLLICLPLTWFTTWSLVSLVAFSSLSMMLVIVLVLSSCSIHKMLLLLPSCHFFNSSVLILCVNFLVAHNSFPSFSHPPISEENRTIGSSAPIFPASFTSHLMLMVGDVMWLIVESFFLHLVQSLFVPTFSLLVYWCAPVYLQKPKTDFTSPSLLTWLLSLLGCMGFSSWLSCQSGIR